MRRVSSPAKGDSSDGDYSGVGSVKTAVPSRNSRRSVDASDASSLLPDGFDSEEGTRSKTSSSLSKRKVLSADGLAMKDAIKVEYGEGCGETSDEALKEAMKDVLQKVVGIYVDSEFRMNNDEIIKDEIITHSNGFIDHYKKIEETNDSNGKTVTIKAWVKMRDFVNRMKKIRPSQMIKLDGVILENELSNEVNAETLLKKEFETFNPAMDLLEVKLADGIRPVVRDLADDVVTLRYVFQVRYAKTKYYQTFLPRMIRVLDQIAEATPRNRNIALDVKKVKLMPATNIAAHSEEGIWKERPVLGHLVKLDGDRGDKKGIRAITAVDGNAVTVREWRLSERLIDVYKGCHAKSYARCKTVACSLVLSDANGKPLANASAQLSDNWYAPYGEYSHPEEDLPEKIDFAPFMGAWCGCFTSYDLKEEKFMGDGWSGEWYDSYVGCIDITIDRKNVVKIKTAKVSLETNNEGVNE